MKKISISNQQLQFHNFFLFSDPAVVQHGIPHIMHYGDFEGYKVLVMTKTGIDLFELSKGMRHGKLNMITICKVAMQSVGCFDIFQQANAKQLFPSKNFRSEFSNTFIPKDCCSMMLNRQISPLVTPIKTKSFFSISHSVNLM